MDVVQNRPVVQPRKGCNPVMATQRSKMQSQRTGINQRLNKQMRLRAGAENLFNATNNPKVKETVALELSFVNSNLQLIKEELSELNSTVDPYQSTSGKTVSIPLIPLGLKDTKELVFAQTFEDYISEHYSEDPSSFAEEIADFTDLRNSVRTPSRNQDGAVLLLEYYNQLYFIENRFFPPYKPQGVFFHWYDSITGLPSVQRSVSLEKASVLFNLGALYSQIGTRADRTRRRGIEVAVSAFQQAAGSFNYLRLNFSNAPTPDLSHSTLSALTWLMLAQGQECVLEMKVFGGFEIQLGKCASIAQEAIKVSDKYSLAFKSMNSDVTKEVIPYSWINMTEVKSHHYRALAHYYAALGLLDQHMAAEQLEITNLLSSLYMNCDDDDVPKPDDVARRKEDRRRLGKSHLKQSVFYHERALQTHSLCKIPRAVDILKEYLQHAHTRSVNKLEEVDSDEDFFDIVEAPDIQGHSHEDTTCIPPAFGEVPSVDIFRRLGPLSIFSVHHRLGAHRTIVLKNDEHVCSFTLQGDAPVSLTSLDQKAKQLGLRNEDILISINWQDVRWCGHNEVADVIEKAKGKPLTLKLVSDLGLIGPSSPTAGIGQSNGIYQSIPEGEVVHRNNNNNNNNNHTGRKKSIQKRHSFGFFHGLRIRPKTLSQLNDDAVSSASDKEIPKHRSVSLQRSSTTTKSFLRAGGTIFRQKKNLSSEYRSQC
uniref:rhophilin-2-like n=1 Tax=Ciona intestinalis TaxID=7719 RepID=UPI0002B8E07E|nr:rhophilin-2-like [Ciona intestinalis]XP_018666799.1 rhophilin-2-like [Ciona intestinalis]|eukprot:XP_002122928.2 rhophilin-2-like [Ciona intestinalis]